MPQAKDLIDEYTQQESAEADETLATLVEFISESGIAEDAVSALCEWIDDEEFTNELTTFLQRKGVSVEEK